MDELYLCLNTSLTPHDLVRLVWSELFDEWFEPVSAATERGKILFGDFADDTKLDGRGRLPLPGEVLNENHSELKLEESSEDYLEAIMSHLDDLCEVMTEESDSTEVAVIGSVPSAFRVRVGEQWRPRFMPAFSFQGGRSSFEMTLFDVSWMLDKDDLNKLVDRLQIVVGTVGDRRLSQIEWNTSGEFAQNDDIWRLFFDGLPLESQSYR